MGLLNITKADVDRSKSIGAGWYDLEIKDYKEDVDKDKAKLHVYQLVVVGGPNDGHLGSCQFSEKAPGFAINFINACAGKDAVGDDGGAFEMKDAVGKKLRGKNEPKNYNGRTIDNWVDFLKSN